MISGFDRWLRPILVVVVLTFAWAPHAGWGAEASNEGEPVDLIEAADEFSMQAAWLSPGERLQWASRQGTQVEFTAGSRRIVLNAVKIFLGDPVLRDEETLLVSRTDFETTLRPILDPRTAPPGMPVRTVIIDPGHGGSDPGTANAKLGLRESDLTLPVAFYLQELLERQGFRVVLTRTRDQYLSLEDRAALVEEVGADLFVSLHFNAVGNSEVEGTETYILTPHGQPSTGDNRNDVSQAEADVGNAHDAWNAVLGYLVHRELLDALGTSDRGLKRARFQVLREVDCPAVLVEAGFLSHAAEAARIETAEYQRKLAHALSVALNRYHNAVSVLSAAAR